MIYNRLIVAAIGFIRLEPYDGKLSRTVLRGGKDSNALLLPDYASVENIVFCCNRSTADHIISSPLFLDPTYERTVPDYSNYAKRFENKQVVAEAVESAKKRKKKQ